jgi:hypothetical protein
MEGEHKFNCAICNDVMIRDGIRFICKNCQLDMRDEYEIKCTNCPDGPDGPGIRMNSEEGWVCEYCFTVINFCYECNVQLQLVNWCVYRDHDEDREYGEETKGEENKGEENKDGEGESRRGRRW